MSEDVPRLPWTDEQWATIQRVVQEAAGKARVASSFLPLVGPLPPGHTTVPALKMDPANLDTDDWTALRLTTIACNVSLTTQQAQDPDLAAARQMLARAAEVIGRLEDAIIFRGQPAVDQPPTDNDRVGGPPVVQPVIYTVRGGGQYPALLDAQGVAPAAQPTWGGQEVESDSLVRAVVAAVQELESVGHYGPFACVLGTDLYLAANSPSASMVLPSDRITPFLDGDTLRRSTVVPPGQGVVVALATSPIDLVVASDVHVKFLQITTDPRYVLRVSERLVLRMKQPAAARLLDAGPRPAPGAGGQAPAQGGGQAPAQGAAEAPGV